MTASGRQAKRRDVIITPFIAIGACVLQSAVAKAEDKSPAEIETQTHKVVSTTADGQQPAAVEDEVINFEDI